MRSLLILVAAFALASASAQAACFEPRAPTRWMSLKKPEPPKEPSCAKLRICSQFEIDAYNSEVQRYDRAVAQFRREAEDYVRKLQTYADQALAYAKCEVADLVN